MIYEQTMFGIFTTKEHAMSYKRILVPVDGSATSKSGIKEALKLARTPGARIRLLHIVDETPILTMPEAGFTIDTVIEDLKRSGKAILAAAKKSCDAQGAKCETAIVENMGRRVADQITADAKRWRADLIVIGTHGRSGVQRLLMGSDAELVVRNTTIPVLLVHGPKARAAAPSRRKK
jgi:nucleotide-binding universal stress UspA family protein